MTLSSPVSMALCSQWNKDLHIPSLHNHIPVTTLKKVISQSHCIITTLWRAGTLIAVSEVPKVYKDDIMKSYDITRHHS